MDPEKAKAESEAKAWAKLSEFAGAWPATSRVEINQWVSLLRIIAGDLREPPRHRADSVLGTTSRRWHRIFTPSSRRHFDVASMAWGALKLISTTQATRPRTQAKPRRTTMNPSVAAGPACTSGGSRR